MSHFWHFFYAGHPWYQGNVWGNVVAVSILIPAGWLWSRTRFWPLKPLRRGIAGLHAKLDAHHARLDEHNAWVHRTLHRMHLEQTGEPPEPHPHFGSPE